MNNLRIIWLAEVARAAYLRRVRAHPETHMVACESCAFYGEDSARVAARRAEAGGKR